MTRADDRAIKRARVRELLATHNLGGVLFTTQKSFSWYTSGGQNHVALNTEAGVASILATSAQDYLIANNIETTRIMREEGLADLGLQPLTYRWDSGEDDVKRLIEHVVPGGRYATESGPHAAEINSMRYSLTPLEVERYRALGSDCAAAVAETCNSIAPGQTEWQIASMLAKALWDRTIIPVVVLVAADERIATYRHPIPTAKAVERCAMAVICGKRYGLILSTTRLVHFGPLSSDLRRKHDAVMHVDAAFIGNTSIGADVEEIFQKALDVYEQTGYDEEWTLHHQGGGTGYSTRDFRATPHCRETVQPWQAYAWNPSITGTKSEDTMIASPDGPEMLSLSKDWPNVEVVGPPEITLHRADILVR